MAARSPSGSAATPASSNARKTTRMASQLRTAPRNFAPSPSPGFAPAVSARWTSSKPAGTTFFDFDISASRSRRLSGTVAMPTAASYSLGAGSPVSALNKRFAPAPVKPTRPRFSIAFGGYRTAVANLLRFVPGVASKWSVVREQEDEEASLEGPPQQGESRQAAPRQQVSRAGT